MTLRESPTGILNSNFESKPTKTYSSSLFNSLFINKKLVANGLSLSWFDELFMSKTINRNKKSNHLIKYSIFLKFTKANYKHLNNFRIFSLKHLYLNSITIKIQTQITILRLIKSEPKIKQSKSDLFEPRW